MPYIPTDKEFNHLIKEVEKLLPARRVLAILFEDKESKLDKHFKSLPVGSTLTYQAQLESKLSSTIPNLRIKNYLDPSHRKTQFTALFELVDELDNRTKLLRGCVRSNGEFNYTEFSKLPVCDQNFDDLDILNDQVHNYAALVEVLTSLWD